MELGSFIVGLFVGAVVIGAGWLFLGRRLKNRLTTPAADQNISPLPAPPTKPSIQHVPPAFEIGRRFYEAIDNLEEGFVLWDPQERFVTCNLYYREMFSEISDILAPGLTFEEFTKARSATHPRLKSDSAREEWIAERLAEHRSPEPASFEVPHDGVNWYRVRKLRLADNSVIAFHLDVSSRRQTEIALLDSEERFRQSFEAAPIGMTVNTPDGEFLMVNPAMCHFLGYEASELIGKTIAEVTHPDDLATSLAMRERAVIDGISGHPQDKRYINKAGEVVWGSVTRAAVRSEDGELLYEIGQVQDIAERMQAEEFQRRSEERFRDFAASAADRYWEADTDGRFTYMSPTPPDSPFREPEEMLGKTMKEVAGANPDEEYLEQFAAASAAKEAYRDLVQHIQLDDGRDYWIRAAGRPIFDMRGEFLGYRGTATDDTERYHAEARAKSTEARFFSAMERVPVGIAYWGPDDRLIMCNSHFWEVNPDFEGVLKPGVSYRQFLEQVALKNPSLGEADRDAWLLNRLADFHTDAFDQEFTRNGRWHRVRRHRLKDGSTLGFHTDVTEIREREEALRHAQKMEAVGQLTGGVAHDFNNLLAAILGNLEIIGDGIENDDPLKIRVDRAIKSTQRGGELTNRLLAFSRRQELDSRPIEMGDLIRGMSDLLNRALGESVRIETNCENGAGRAMVDINQMENAILNLAINSRDAMPNGGTIEIGCWRRLIEDDTVISNEAVLSGDYVAVTVSDKGEGISAEVLEHVLEPFFTTKDVGQGSGLGLSMVYGFVRQSGGYLDIQSQQGQGTQVTIYLPAHGEQAGAEPDALENTSVPRGSGERIFIIEDDIEVREVATAILVDLGYQVIDGGDGLTALETMDNCGEVDLLLTDVVLPHGLSGPDLARRARQSREHLKVLYMTGYAENSTMPQGWLGLAPSLITKPFEKSQLAIKVRETLDQFRH